MRVPDWLIFLERTYRSANTVPIRDDCPVLVHTCYGSDLSTTEDLLREASVTLVECHPMRVER
jgi:hypothetical protein